MNTITISKRQMAKGGVVVLPLKEYERLKEQSIPTHYLTGKKALALDKLVTQGLKEHKESKTVIASSLEER